MLDSVIPAEWIAKAQRDLLSARILRSASPPLLEQAIYFAAQAAEKSFKALLVKRRAPYRSFRHDITVLLKARKTIEPGLSVFDVRLANFGAYNMDARYPISRLSLQPKPR